MDDNSFEQLLANADAANDEHTKEMEEEGITCSTENPEECEGCGA